MRSISVCARGRRGTVAAGCRAALVIAAALLCGCPDRHVQGPVSAPAPRVTPAANQTIAPAAAAPTATPVGATATRPAASRPATTRATGDPHDFTIRLDSPDSSHTEFWLTIVRKTHADRPAEARGRVLEERKLFVDTLNVDGLKVHLGRAPVRRDRSLGLFLDGQSGIEIRSSSRRTMELRRSKAGIWEQVPDPRPPGRPLTR